MNTMTINSRNAGLFSILLHTLDNLYWCEQNKFFPKIEWMSGFYSVNNTDNVWDYYFEKINTNYEIENSNINLVSDCFRSDNFIYKKGNWPDRAMFWDKLNNEEGLITRQKVNICIEKYIKLKQNIQDKINNFKINDKTIGIHIRGTDYLREKNPPIPLNKFIDSIKSIDNYEDYEMLVASDNFESIELVKNTFKNVRCYPCMYRQEKYTSPSTSCFVNGINKKTHGEEALIEAVLLSKCNKLVSTTSNIATFALYYNPNNEFVLVE